MNSITPNVLTPFRPIPLNTPPDKTDSSPPPSDPPSTGIVVEITPGTDNVSSGDKSQNTAQISISTPNNSFETEISRAQFFTGVERRTQKKVAQAYYTGQEGNIGGGAKYLAVQAGALENDNVEELALLSLRKDQAAVYATTYQNATAFYEDYSPSSSSSSSDSSNENSQQNASYQATEAASAYNKAKQSLVKQEFVFATLDRIRIDLEV